MTAAATANLSMALEWAALAVAVLPVCGPTEDHQCGCPGRPHPHTDKDIGKAPYWEKKTLEHGVEDATTDPEQLRAWWANYPNANVAIDLASAQLFAIDCDSPQAEAEAVARGLRGGIRRVSGHGNLYLFLRPPDCPTYRPTHNGESKSIDLLTGGYAIVYGTHASGADIYTEPVELPTEYAPAWAVEQLKARAARTGADVDLEIDDDEPPVPLSGDALRRWKGELPYSDRSLWLWDVGIDLAENGMTANGIVLTLADYDRRRGIHKYSDRRDGGKTEYARIAGKALKRAAEKAGEPRIVFDHAPEDPPGGACERCAQLEAVNAENGELIRELCQAVRRYGGKFGVAFDMAARCASAVRRATAEGGFVKYSLVGAAIDVYDAPTGSDPESQREREQLAKKVTRAYKHWVGTDAFLEVEDPPEFEQREVLNKQTGAYEPKTIPIRHKRIALNVPARQEGECPDLVDFLHYLNRVQLEEEHRGGKREPRQCPHHSNADYVVTTTTKCAKCETHLAPVTFQTHPRKERRPDFPAPFVDYSSPPYVDPPKTSVETESPSTVDVSIAPQIWGVEEIDWANPEANFTRGDF